MGAQGRLSSGGLISGRRVSQWIRNSVGVIISGVPLEEISGFKRNEWRLQADGVYGISHGMTVASTA